MTRNAIKASHLNISRFKLLKNIYISFLLNCRKHKYQVEFPVLGLMNDALRVKVHL